jgi:hypothetical protein
MTSNDVRAFLKVAVEAQNMYIAVLDALQASRPFYSEMFKPMLITYHMGWTEFMAAYWSSQMKQFDVGLSQ